MDELPPEARRLRQIHVNIGDCAFAARPALFTTVLGSCVSATFHHPEAQAGGMFHAMLPEEALRRPGSRTRPCTFADSAVDAVLARFRASGMAPAELAVRLFGGANIMFDRHGVQVRDMLDVGKKNVESALAALARHGLRPQMLDVRGRLGRKLCFATATGEVWMDYLEPELAAARAARGRD